MKTTISLSEVEISLFAILFGTLLNGFFNSLSVAYGFTTYPMSTFLFDSSDLHADLVKLVLSFMQHDTIKNFSEWSPLYQGYFLHNPYGGVASLEANALTHFTAPPLMVNMSILLSKIILLSSPDFLVKLFYLVVFFGIFALSIFFQKSKRMILILIAMLSSYPILFILTRGHIFSFISGILLIGFFYNIVKKNNILIPIILLAIVVNFRPNAAILSMLFIVYGLREGFRGVVFFCVASIGIFYINLLVAHSVYTDYTLENFTKAVKIYFKMYVLGSAGDAFNNSLFGAIKTFSMIFQIDLSAKLKTINSVISISFIGILLTSAWLFIKKWINRYELSFVAMSIYALASSVFATYHMLVFFTFLLISIKNIEKIYSPRYLNIIFATSVFVLIPKNYYHFNSISIETILNPAVMSCAIVYILVKSFLSRDVNIHSSSKDKIFYDERISDTKIVVVK